MIEEIEAEVSEHIVSKIKETQFKPTVKSVGNVTTVGDGVVAVSGIKDAFMGEIIENANGFRGMVLNLRKETAEVIVLEGFENLKEGVEVYTTGHVLKVPSGEALVGRVVNSLGEPVDGMGEIKTTSFMPIERKASGIIQRQSVDRPLQTGIKAIDALVPIGRGQRELIIGDRATGKTALAIDTIINQKVDKNKEKPVICFYIAIGQKESKIAKIVGKLKETGAFEHTVVVVAGASDPVSWQYIAPYSGCAMAEYFLDKGEDALVIYDDLTKHAWAYRELSLVLRRPPGREAYPGDIFYLHSKLLERSCQLSSDLKGGSLTALPIIETQAGDVSAYIPTNVISITDGQIYLDRDLFNSGFRPSINVGLSVSRVGGKAQVKIMKQLTGKLRLELAQFRELSAFSQFAADLDQATREKLESGEKSMEILKQDQYKPLKFEEQSVIFWAANNGFLTDIKLSEVKSFVEELVLYFQTGHQDLLSNIREQKQLSAELEQKLKEALIVFKETRTYANT